MIEIADNVNNEFKTTVDCETGSVCIIFTNHTIFQVKM